MWKDTGILYKKKTDELKYKLFENKSMKNETKRENDLAVIDAANTLL